MPGLVAGAGPAHTPGPVILPKTAGPVLSLPPHPFIRDPNDHPPRKLHLPVAPYPPHTLLAEHLERDKGQWRQSGSVQIGLIHSHTQASNPSMIIKT
ncbi:hypothetical protein AAFF_G00366000 [Aldrovandia affinis]|uniref:Uncharacterized protein n=1 Tax=Aldrovandia affinis TaxID=143900 RepID=A0AAD7SHU7_9TELE|nr:hypothetical protein AAFF_G00366000 [Aldrovandia affinis]